MADHGSGTNGTSIWRVAVGATMPLLLAAVLYLGDQVIDNAKVIERNSEIVRYMQNQLQGQVAVRDEVVKLGVQLQYISEQIESIHTELRRKADKPEAGR